MERLRRLPARELALPAREPPLPGESLQSLLRRHALAMGYEDVNDHAALRHCLPSGLS